MMNIYNIFQLNFTILFIYDAKASKGEKRLLTDLFRTYKKDIRPVDDINDTIKVSITHTIKQIIDVDERKELLLTSGWCSLKWRDSYLSWKPSKYDGINSINISPKKVWIPDIVLYDNINRDVLGRQVKQLRNRLTVDYFGNVAWGVRATFVTQCHFNIRKYPFDIQSCSLRYGSWSYVKGRIDICPKSKIKIEYNGVHYAWIVTSSSSQILTKQFTGGIYESIRFSITFKRTALCHSVTVLLPPLVVGILVMLSFVLPAASGGRLTFSTTLLLAMIFFMVNSTRLIPRDDATLPIIYKFFIATLLEILLLHIFLIFGMQFYYKTPYDPPMPRWIRNIIFDKLSYWVRSRPVRNENHNISLQSEELLSIIEIGFINSDHSNVRTKSTSQLNQSINQESMEGEIILMEWRTVAMTVDRCLFLVFSLTFVIIIFVFSFEATNESCNRSINNKQLSLHNLTSDDVD